MANQGAKKRKEENSKHMVIYVIVRLLILHSSVTWKHFVGLLVTSAAYALSYLHDIIYITSFVQVMSILSGKFWYTYLVIPAFAAYKLSGLAKGFLSHDSDGVPEDEKNRKKREKLEKKASRPKFVKTSSK
ncbi:hypothetical protein MKX01_042390 [Papaver californicum]|nr:hypothetical protein MKX01_042390 [Papaver californicum]